MADPIGNPASGDQAVESMQAAAECSAIETNHALEFLQRVVGPDVIELFTDPNTAEICLEESLEAASGALPGMFMIVNSFALTATALVVLYIISIGVLHTAHEGESLGKRYSTLWTPIRAALGVTFVAPAPMFMGFSALQVIIVGLVVLSNAGANTLWSYTVDYFVEHRTVLANPGFVQTDPRQSFMALQAEACTHHQYEQFSQTKEGMSLIESVEAYKNSASTGAGWDTSFHSSAYAQKALDDVMPKRWNNSNKFQLEWFPECGTVDYACDKFSADSAEGKFCKLTYQAQIKNSTFFKDKIVPALYKAYFEGVPIDDLTFDPPSLMEGDPTTERYEFSADTHPIIRAIAHADEVQVSAYRAVFGKDVKDEDGISQALQDWKAAVDGDWTKAGQWHWVLHKITHETIGAANNNPMWTVASEKNMNYEELRVFRSTFANSWSRTS